jgi:acetyltransferase-like isoleucine patch superfamily enzyme
VIGPGVVIDSFVKIKPVGGVGDVEIGSNTYINSGTVIYSGNGVRIGAGVLIAANCTLAAVNHEYRARGRTIMEQGFMPSRGGIVIEDDVWLGAGSVVLDGARIAKGVVVGANSLVRGNLDEYTVYAGNPLRALSKRG